MMHNGDANLEPITERRQRVVQDDDDEEYVDLSDDGEFVVAVDENNKRILIEGIASITAPVQFRLMNVLITSYREDQAAGLSADNYRPIRAVELADRLDLASEEAVRKRVSEIRQAIRQGFRDLFRIEPQRNTIIETVSGKRGYRINPKARVVAPDQIKR